MTESASAEGQREVPRVTDVERLQVLARLIRDRMALLDTIAAARKFTPAEAREREILIALRDDWLLEGQV